jgi:ubiquinone/menaquinone biosynthesis C-methylase UbiE
MNAVEIEQDQTMAVTDTDLAERVKREKASNEDDDIIGRAHGLKQRFHHVWRTTERVRSDEQAILSGVENKRVLDYGCGKGDFALKLLERGARVDGIDIAQTYIDECNEAARAAGYEAGSYCFQVMDAHKLTFEDDSFDFVVGNGILHHLNF